MKLVPVATLAGIVVSGGCVLISYNNHTDECARFNAQQMAAREAANAPNPWEEAFKKAGMKEPVRRENLVPGIEGTINAFPGVPACSTNMTDMELLNSILAGILMFAALVIPPTVIRGMFPNRKH